MSEKSKNFLVVLIVRNFYVFYALKIIIIIIYLIIKDMIQFVKTIQFFIIVWLVIKIYVFNAKKNINYLIDLSVFDFSDDSMKRWWI